MEKLNCIVQRLVDMVKNRKWIEVILLLVLLVQFLITIYFNLMLLENHMGHDSSWSYLKAALMWNEKTITSDMWVEQTNIFLDSSMPLASFIYGLTGMLLPSYGLANIIILMLILICIDGIMRKMNIELKGRLFALNLIICPYLTNGFNCRNDLGYFNDLISGPAFYSLRALIVLLIIREFIFIKNKGKIGLLGIITFFLCALSGASSGIFIIIMILLPYLLYQIECMLIENNVKILLKREAVYGYLCCISVFLGKYFAANILKIEAIDETRTWTPLSKLWTNIGAVFQGFMKLLNVLPVEETNVAILTDEGIYRLFPLAIFIVVILSFVYAGRKIAKDIKTEEGIIQFIINIVACNFIIFSLFNARYGAKIFEERYLICTFMAIVLLVAYYIQNLKVNHIYSTLICIVLLVSLIGNNYVSDKKYIETTNESWQMDEIYQIVSEGDAELIYFWGNSPFLPLARSMRVYDLERVYKLIMDNGKGYYHWGDYKYYDNNEDYKGTTYLVVDKANSDVPEHILCQYELVKELNYVLIYRSESNPIDIYAGFTGDVSFDYPYSTGVRLRNGTWEENYYVTDGTAGYAMWGPYVQTVDGIYDFTLNYEILEMGQESASFDVTTESGHTQLGIMELEPQNTQATISNVVIESGHTLEYRVYCGNGVKIKIKNIVITKK